MHSAWYLKIVIAGGKEGGMLEWKLSLSLLHSSFPLQVIKRNMNIMKYICLENASLCILQSQLIWISLTPNLEMKQIVIIKEKR